MRLEIIDEREAAEEEAKTYLPGCFIDLSKLLSRADSLAQDRIASASYRHEWEGRLEGTAQFWEGGNLGLVGERIRALVDRLHDCESEAAQLSELVAKTRRELRL